MKQLLVAIAVSAVSLTAATVSQAATFVYDLADHPDGALSGTRDYGIRLDAQLPDPRFFTFGNGSSAQLIYNDQTRVAEISGTVFESTGVGRVGEAYALSYTFENVRDLTGGFFVQETNESGGSLTLGAETISLATSSNGDFYFRFDNDGHRLAAQIGIAGRGWVASGTGANDFLFTATPAPVPLPAAAWMLLAGLGGLGVVARRKKKS